MLINMNGNSICNHELLNSFQPEWAHEPIKFSAGT
jgi:hypothetical protein